VGGEDSQRMGIFGNAPVSGIATSEAKWGIDRNRGDVSH